MRFVINSTVGILGFVDVASWIGLDKKDKEDYGQTLGCLLYTSPSPRD